ncbi:MAG: nitronate monooxygenase [Rhodocyclaceae bacterium]|nr:nitronate monooxygenase [Rhodocyclaceae bacterium]
MNLHALLGTELPLIQAPMAGSQASALALAVCAGGGVGSLPCAMLGADALRAELALLQAAATRPFNLNFFCHRNPPPDDAAEQAWRALLSPYYAEFGVDPAQAVAGAARRPFDADMADIVCACRPAFVSFHFGLPEPGLMAKVRSCGAKILSSATTVAEARWLAARGVDAVIAQGAEAGGHRGMFLDENPATQVGTFALLPQVVAAVDVPVIAAGGIADARGVAAALALGAAAVQVGSAYLLCPESAASAVHRAALKSDGAGVTALTNLFSGRPARGIVNRLMRELGPLNTAAPRFPLAAAALAPLRARAEAAGCGDFSPLWAGQNLSGCKEIPAAQLTRALMGVA